MRRLKDIARAVRARYHLVQDGAVRVLAGATRREFLVREQVRGDDPLSNVKLAAVYVHFDGNGHVHDYVVHQLRELVDAGFRITFVTNSPIFPEASRDRVAPFCGSIIWRFNTGYDFGAYKDGIAALEGIDQLEGLVLMNDSVYGPFWKLRRTLEAIDRSTCDFWGITDSWEQRYHIQSFFIFFFANALRSDAFKKFWRHFPYINDKGWVIRNGEIMMTQALMRQQLRGCVLAPYWFVAETAKNRLAMMEKRISLPSDRSAFERFRAKILADRAVNPTQYFWDVLISDYKCPFIKRELLKSNPANIPFLSHWSEVITSQSDYDTAMIHQHLQSLAAPNSGFLASPSNIAASEQPPSSP